jgi:uncharacterized SAM-binding protein YcdF (DUF218 family)
MDGGGAGERAGSWQRACAAAAGGAASGALGFLSLSSLLFALAGGGAIWISSPLPGARAWHLAVAVASGLLAAARLRPLRRGRRALAAAAFLFALRALWDSGRFYAAWAEGALRASCPVPLSLVLALLLAGEGVRLLSRSAAAALAAEPPTPAHASPDPGGMPAASPALWLLRGAAALAGATALLLAFLVTFGCTDYRRPADCAIVLGAGVRADGTPSLALADRIAEGVRLYHEGLVPLLVMTGGTGRWGHSEAAVMREQAIAAGVPAAAILLDEEGTNTRASAANCRALMERHGLATALLVSHYYHLARCKEVFRRQGNLESGSASGGSQLAPPSRGEGSASRLRFATVPAPMSRRLAREPYYLLRECAAYVVYALPGSNP